MDRKKKRAASPVAGDSESNRNFIHFNFTSSAFWNTERRFLASYRDLGYCLSLGIFCVGLYFHFNTFLVDRCSVASGVRDP
jgi:hypothetical protein